VQAQAESYFASAYSLTDTRPTKGAKLFRGRGSSLQDEEKAKSAAPWRIFEYSPERHGSAQSPGSPRTL
jgi:hypothetical protein